MIKRIKEIYLKYDKKYNLSKYIPVVLYLFFGVVTTIVNIVVYTILARVFKIDYALSNVIAWICSVIVAYITNKIYVFKSDVKGFLKGLYEIVKFVAVRLVTLGMDMLVMYIGITLLKLDDVLMKCLANIIVIIANYFLSKYIVFIKKKNNVKP